VINAISGKALRSISNLPTNSAAKCWASAAEPHFHKQEFYFQFLLHFVTFMKYQECHFEIYLFDQRFFYVHLDIHLNRCSYKSITL